jgi:hypothetical protein
MRKPIIKLLAAGAILLSATASAGAGREPMGVVGAGASTCAQFRAK